MSPDIERIYQQFLDGRCSREDAERLLDYFQSQAGNADMVTLIERELDKPVTGDEYGPVDGFSADIQLQQLYHRMGPGARTRNVHGLRRWMSYAAAALVLAGAGMYWFAKDEQPTPQPIAYQATDIPPGGNRAQLSFADGRSITLDENHQGIVVGADDITYSDGRALGIPLTDTLVLETPKGGTYSVKLPDGSDVWLNAGSTLKYPSQFDAGERTVELEGEAYFDIASVPSPAGGEQWPFRVVSQGQTLEVTGTEFNVSAYAGEARTTTTLVEGAVRLKPTGDAGGKYLELKSGQQAATVGSDITIAAVDVAPFIAWKSGFFHFKHTRFEDMMGQIERWYNVEVVYESTVPKDTFGGRIRRDVSLLTALELLKASEVGFRIVDNQLIIE